RRDAPHPRLLRAPAELSELLDRGRLRGRDARDPRGARARRDPARARASVRSLAPGRHALRQRDGRSRGRRGVAGDRGADTDRGRLLDARRSDGRARGAHPGVPLTRPITLDSPHAVLEFWPMTLWVSLPVAQL